MIISERDLSLTARILAITLNLKEFKFFLSIKDCNVVVFLLHNQSKKSLKALKSKASLKLDQLTRLKTN